MRFKTDIVCLMREMHFSLDRTMKKMFYITVTDMLNKF
jgi:hypothetical protein